MDSDLRSVIYKALYDAGVVWDAVANLELLSSDMCRMVETFLAQKYGVYWPPNARKVYREDYPSSDSDSSKSAPFETGVTATMTVGGHVFNLSTRSLAYLELESIGSELIAQNVDGTWLQISIDRLPERLSSRFRQYSEAITGGNL